MRSFYHPVFKKLNFFKSTSLILTLVFIVSIGAVKAQYQKQLNGLKKLENRLLKAEKRKHQSYINNLAALHAELFPNGILQERIENISNYLLQNKNSIGELKVLLNPLSLSLDVISIR